MLQLHKCKYLGVMACGTGNLFGDAADAKYESSYQQLVNDSAVLRYNPPGIGH